MTLNLLDLSILKNDPVSHNLAWSTIPTKLPSNIPKFEFKASEDHGEDVTTFHLWCYSNSLHDDSIHLRLFQCTLMGLAVKWYIELPGGPILRLMTFPWIFLIISSYSYVTTSVPNSCQPFDKTKPHVFQIILETIINCTLQVPQNMIYINQVNISQICQELAQGVHSKANVCVIHLNGTSLSECWYPSCRHTKGHLWIEVACFHYTLVDDEIHCLYAQLITLPFEYFE